MRQAPASPATFTLKDQRIKPSQPGSTNKSNGEIFFYVLLLAIGALQFAFCLKSELFENDATHYMGLAQSLIEKHSYEFNFAKHTIYPPGFPILLAAISLITGAGGYRNIHPLDASLWHTGTHCQLPCFKTWTRSYRRRCSLSASGLLCPVLLDDHSDH